MADVYFIVIKCRFTQFSESRGFPTGLQIYFKAMQKEPELVINTGAAISQH